jgi:hypothetical protein
MAHTEHARPIRKEGQRLQELRRSNAAGIHQDRRTKRVRARRDKRLAAIKESMA